MRTQAAYDEQVSLVAAADAGNDLLTGGVAETIERRERKGLLVVALTERQPMLPGIRNAARGKRCKSVLGFEGLLALYVAVQPRAEHPIVPGIAHLGRGLRGCAVGNLQQTS